MRNYPYRQFLSFAREALSRSVASARKVTDSLGLTFGFDAGFPWRDEFRDAVGRCGVLSLSGDSFDISVHMRAIYQCMREMEESDIWYPLDDWEREKEVAMAVDTTVFHEVAHGIYRHFRDVYFEDDDFRLWCDARGFGESLFAECDGEEAVAEEYGWEKEQSVLGEFIAAFGGFCNGGEDICRTLR